MLKKVSIKFFLLSMCIIILFGAVSYSLIFVINEKIQIHSFSKKLNHTVDALANEYINSNNNSSGMIYLRSNYLHDYNLGSIVVSRARIENNMLLINESTVYTLGSRDENNVILTQQQKLSELFQKYQKRFLSGKTIEYRINDENGNAHLVSIHPVLVNKKLDAIILAEAGLQTSKIIFANIPGYCIFLFVFAFVISSVITVFLSMWIMQPLKQLEAIAIRISKQDFTKKSDLHTKDEIEDLSKAINSISDNCSQVFRALNEKNTELKKILKHEKEYENIRKSFVSDVSHELKTPISIIKGYLEGYMDSLEKGNLKVDYLDVVRDETEKMDILVNDMLNMSRLESGNIVLNLELFAIDQLIQYCIGKIPLKSYQDRIEIKTLFEEENMLSYGDSLKIEQVITNILNNAMKFTPEGGFVEIEARYTDEGNVYVSILNSGSFIHEDDLEKIWEKFYRADKSRSKKVTGTGLGLSIVKSILELHESGFGAENVPEGVKFYFTLKGQKIKTNFNKLQ